MNSFNSDVNVISTDLCLKWMHLIMLFIPKREHSLYLLWLILQAYKVNTLCHAYCSKLRTR